MARLRMTDLPKDVTISKDEMKRVRGGAFDCFLKIEGVPGECTDPLPLEEVSFASQDKASPQLA